MSQKTVIITTDLSEASTSAFSIGCDHVKELNDADTEIIGLYIAAPFELPVVLQRQLTEPEDLQKMTETYEKEEQERLAEFINELKLPTSVTPLTLFSEEKASNQILQVAQEKGASLIVMTTRGRGALGNLLLGSTTTNVLSHSHCPVLIIPATTETSNDS